MWVIESFTGRLRLMLPQDPDDLLFREPSRLHRRLPSKTDPTSIWRSFRGSDQCVIFTTDRQSGFLTAHELGSRKHGYGPRLLQAHQLTAQRIMHGNKVIVVTNGLVDYVT